MDFRGKGDSGARFQPTRWSMVVQARGGHREALEELCRAYWYPAYAFLRKRGLSPSDSQDLVQEFFLRKVLGGKLLLDADQHRGSFRAWFAQSLRNFLANESERRDTAKRGGQVEHVPLHLAGLDRAEERYATDPVDPGAGPEALYDRAFAAQLVARALEAVRREYAGLKKTDIFQALLPCITTGAEQGTHPKLAKQLGIEEDACRQHLRRLKVRFQKQLVTEVTELTGDPESARAELRHLLDAWISR